MFIRNQPTDQVDQELDWTAVTEVFIVSTPELVNDDRMRSGGIACRIQSATHDRDLLLTEFPDPDGEAVDLLPAEISGGVDIELVRR